MRTWEKYLAIVASVIYLVCLTDFVTRSDEDITKKSTSCGVLSKVEFSNPSGYRGSGLATMVYLITDNGPKKYRIKRSVNESQGILFSEPLERTYLNSEPYVFWLFLIPVSFVLTKLLNHLTMKKRKNA